jgi:hypothetical protein
MRKLLCSGYDYKKKICKQGHLEGKSPHPVCYGKHLFLNKTEQENNSYPRVKIELIMPPCCEEV